MRFTQVQTRTNLWIGVLVLFSLVVLFGGLPTASQAKPLLYIDFETTGLSKTFPDKKFNKGSEWMKGAQNPKLVEWINLKWNGSGKLFQTRNTNPMTTTTVAPGCNKGWTDYTVQMTVTYEDDDKWPLVFRYTNENNYYFAAVEQADSNEKGKDPQMHLHKAPAADGGFNGTPVVPPVKMPGVEIQQGAGVGDDKATLKPQEKQEWVIRVNVKGSSITCWFFERVKIRNLDDPAPNKPIIEAKDNSNPKGCVGIRNDTIVGTIDDFAVYTEGRLAVDAKGKLTTTWGTIKATRN